MAPTWPDFGPQEAPKKASKSLRNGPKEAGGFMLGVLGEQVGSKADFASILERFGVDIGSIVGWFLIDFLLIFDWFVDDFWLVFDWFLIGFWLVLGG